ncbi:hypothetical protein HY251_11150 [bacterium]|nr:hypothetical protein [bacterium]
MLQALGRTDGWRLLAGALFFLALGVHDWRRHPEDPRRAKEYLFLLYSMLLSVLYAVLHDHVTATISREYFLYGKGLVDDPRPFRVAVTVLAAHAGYGPGLFAGACLLLANNPRPTRPQLPYRDLARLAALPLGGAVLAAALGAALFSRDVFHQRELARELAGERWSRFLATWGIHYGTYSGAALGTIAAVVIVLRARRRKAAPVKVPEQQPLDVRDARGGAEVAEAAQRD